MQIEIFNIEMGDSAELQRCNNFLRSNRIVQVQTQFIQGNITSWSILVTYAGTKSSESKSTNERIDYRTVLAPQDFIRYARMREARKKMALDTNVPPFVIFTNEELALLAVLPELNAELMQKVEGIGNKRMEKYGHRFLEVYALGTETSE